MPNISEETFTDKGLFAPTAIFLKTISSSIQPKEEIKGSVFATCNTKNKYCGLQTVTLQTSYQISRNSIMRQALKRIYSVHLRRFKDSSHEGLPKRLSIIFCPRGFCGNNRAPLVSWRPLIGKQILIGTHPLYSNITSIVPFRCIHQNFLAPQRRVPRLWLPTAEVKFFFNL